MKNSRSFWTLQGREKRGGRKRKRIRQWENRKKKSTTRKMSEPRSADITGEKGAWERKRTLELVKQKRGKGKKNRRGTVSTILSPDCCKVEGFRGTGGV